MPGPASKSAAAPPSGQRPASPSKLDAAFEAASARLAKASSRERLGEAEAKAGAKTAASNSKSAGKMSHLPHMPHLPQPHMPHLPKAHLPTSLSEMMRSTKSEAQTAPQSNQQPALVLSSQQAALAKSAQQDVKCPAGHKLEEFVSDGRGFSCDECHKSFPAGQKLRGCRRCNYDLCGDCQTKVKALQKPARPFSTPPSSGRGPGALFTSVLFNGSPAKDTAAPKVDDASKPDQDDDAKVNLFPTEDPEEALQLIDSTPASARSSGSLRRAVSSAPSKDLRVAGTHMVDMVLPWLKPEPPPPYCEVVEEHNRREQRLRTEAREREMDMHVQEVVKSHVSRGSLRHSLSSKAAEHNSWQSQVEDAARAFGWAMAQVVGGCSASPPASQAPGTSGPCCSARTSGEDYRDFDSMPGITRVVDPDGRP